MLPLNDPGKVVIVGIIYLLAPLIVFLLKRFMFKPEGSVGKFTEFIIEKGINGTGIDHLIKRDLVFYIPIVRLKHNRNIRMRQHLSKHFSVSMLWHSLV